MMSSIFKICILYASVTLAYSYGYSCKVVANFPPRGGSAIHIFNPSFPLRDNCEDSYCYWGYYTREEQDFLQLNCSVLEFSDDTLMTRYGKMYGIPDVNHTEPFYVNDSAIAFALKSEKGCYNGRFYCTLDPPGGAKDVCDCKKNDSKEMKFPSKGTLVFNYNDLCEDVLIIGSRMAVTTADVLVGKLPLNYSLLAGGYDISDMDMRSKNEVLVSVSAFIIHDEYQPGKNLNNFGLVILSADLIFGPRIQRACLLSNLKPGALLEQPGPKANKMRVFPSTICQLKYQDFSKEQHFCVIGPEIKCETHPTPLYYTSDDNSYGVGLISHKEKCGILKPKVAINVKYFIDTMVKKIYPEAELCRDTN